MLASPLQKIQSVAPFAECLTLATASTSVFSVSDRLYKRVQLWQPPLRDEALALQRTPYTLTSKDGKTSLCSFKKIKQQNSCENTIFDHFRTGVHLFTFLTESRTLKPNHKHTARWKNFHITERKRRQCRVSLHRRNAQWRHMRLPTSGRGLRENVSNGRWCLRLSDAK